MIHFTPISIHAPVKGATAITDTPTERPRYFNPRPREGSDYVQDKK